MLKKILLLFFASFLVNFSNAQCRFLKKTEAYRFSVFNNQYYLPFAGVKNIFTSKYHLGLSAGIVKNIKEKKKSTTYYDLMLGVYHHRFIQTGIQLYGNVGYRYKLPQKFYISSEFGIGYLHALIHQKSFKADDNGNYSKVKTIGKPQLLIAIGIIAGKQVNILNKQGRIFLNYQPWFQMPYIKSYVPLLPNNSFHLGFDLIIDKKK